MDKNEETQDIPEPPKSNDCPHLHQEFRTLEVYCTCELKAFVCLDCGEQLTEIYWDC